MIAIVHSIYSQSVLAPALNAELMDNDAERHCIYKYIYIYIYIVICSMVYGIFCMFC